MRKLGKLRELGVRSLAAALVPAVVAVGAGCGEDSGAEAGTGRPEEREALDELRVAVPVAEGQTTLDNALEPLNEAYTEATGLPVELVEVSDGNSIIEAVRAGRVDVVALSGFLLQFAGELADIEVVAAARGSEDVSAIVVRADSDIQDIEDLRGRSIALGDPNSAGSGMQPRMQLLDAGIDPESDLDVSYTGTYDAALLAVANGTVDAAGTRPFVMEMLAENGGFDTDALRIVNTSDPLPLTLAIAASDSVPGEVVEDLRTFLLGDDGLAAMREISPLVDEMFVPDEETNAYFQEGIESLDVSLEDVE